MSPLAWTALVFVLMVLAGQKWRSTRQRSALNRALHEIRRPLQALVLLAPGLAGPPAGIRGSSPGTPRFPPLAPATGLAAGSASAPRTSSALFPPGPGPGTSLAEPVLQALSAVGDLDRELNGGVTPGPRSEILAVRLMADGCMRRWQSRAALSGARIALLWSGPDVLVRGDAVALAGAVENLIVNAIEHGGPEITVTGRTVGSRVRIEVRDNGVEARPEGRPDTPAQTLARLRGRGAHGHGLAVAGEAASAHGGRLETAFDAEGSSTAIVLPRATKGYGSSAAVRVNW